MTDLELQQFLAKMLPDDIHIEPLIGLASGRTGEYDFYWKRLPGITVIDCNGRFCEKVRPDGWLHVCWLIERGLTSDQLMQFAEHLRNQLCDQERVQPYYEVVGLIARASWQQRAAALIEVKGEK